MILVEIWAIIIMAGMLWFLLILDWMNRNPEYAKQVKNKEAPYPWFFWVWCFLILSAAILSIVIIFYYIICIIILLIH